MTTRITFDDFERLGRLTKAASTDMARPILAGVYIEADGRTVKATATNSYMLAHTEFRAERGKKKWAEIVDAKQLAETVALFRKVAKSRKVHLSAAETVVKLTPEASQVYASLDSDGSSIAASGFEVVDGKYPNYRNLMVKPTERVPASKLKWKTNAEIRTYLNGQGVHPADNQTKAQMLESVERLHDETFEERDVALNPKYLNELTKTTRVTDHLPVRIEMFGSLRPVWLSAPSDPEWVGLLMPVRA